MRLTTDFFVAAMIRRVRGEGGFAYLVRRGATEAGALFIMQRHNNGQVNLYGPAPQSLYESETIGNDRLFISLLTNISEEEVTARLEKELRFDPDIWLVELENYASVEGLFPLAKPE